MASSRTLSPVASPGQRLLSLYATEAANSIAALLLAVGLSFYTSYRFGWGAKENFSVAAFQGIFYMLGALSAKQISRRWGRQKSLTWLYSAMTACAVAAGTSSTMGWTVATASMAVIETGLVAASWPMLQSLVSAAGEPESLSKRLGWYNIIWSGVGAVAVATSGTVIQHASAWGFFGIVATGHMLAALLVLFAVQSPNQKSTGQPESGRVGDLKLDEATLQRHHLALWLSRIALPSTYVIVYSIAPALPSLHAIRQLTPTTATLVGSVWLIARSAAFAIMGNTTFWHKRPGLLFLASVVMVTAFIGTIVPGALTGIGLVQALIAMVLAQTALGISIGTIYSGSLYFGMAVSDGSTAHGGYHEALVGLGQILGPLMGATMQWIYPGTLWPSMATISGLASLSVAWQAVVGIRAGRKRAAWKGAN